MTKILAVADEVEESLYASRLDEIDPDLVLACGDLPFDYLEYLVTRTNVPLLYVPGNHDPDLRERSELVWPPTPQLRGLEDPPGPQGCVNVDGRVLDAAGVRIAGLGGSVRYKDGPNQYTQREMRGRARRLRRRVARRRLRDRRGVDVLVTHAPPRGLGDDGDPAHVGIEALRGLIERIHPALVLHGHIHPYGSDRPDRAIGATRILNVVPSRVVELEP